MTLHFSHNRYRIFTLFTATWFFFAGFDEVSSTGSDGLSGNSCDCCLCHLRAWSGDWVWGKGVPRQRNILRKPFSRSQLDCAGDISMDKSIDSFIYLDQDLLKSSNKFWIRCSYWIRLTLNKSKMVNYILTLLSFTENFGYLCPFAVGFMKESWSVF